MSALSLDCAVCLAMYFKCALPPGRGGLPGAQRHVLLRLLFCGGLKDAMPEATRLCTRRHCVALRLTHARMRGRAGVVVAFQTRDWQLVTLSCDCSQFWGVGCFNERHESLSVCVLVFVVCAGVSPGGGGGV